jgi:putative SOS response-associated peptidase YedK
MCGRFVSPADAEIERRWHVGRDTGRPLLPNYNTSPGAAIPILCATGKGIALRTARWGLVPPWWKTAEPPQGAFNARLEEAASKPMWRHPLRYSRCLVPASGWYEWQAVKRRDTHTGKEKDAKQPHFVCRKDGALLLLAGLLSTRTTPEQEAPILTCAILTTAATGTLAGLHERMPVVLDDAALAEWLDASRTKETDAAVTLRTHSGLAACKHHPVGMAVNDARSQGAHLMDKAA